MSLNQRVTAEFSTCTPSAPPTADLSIQTIHELWSCSKIQLTHRIACIAVKATTPLEFESAAHDDRLSCDRRMGIRGET